MILVRRARARLYRVVAIALTAALLLQSSPLMAGPDPRQLHLPRQDESRAPVFASEEDASSLSAPIPVPARRAEQVTNDATPAAVAIVSNSSSHETHFEDTLPLALPVPEAYVADAQTLQPAITPVPQVVKDYFDVPQTILPPVSNDISTQYRLTLKVPGLAAPVPAASVNLQTGWNLVSLPEIPPDTDPAAVLASIAGNYRLVYAYDACDTADPWKLYDPAAPVASDLTAIDHTIGFWIEMTAADTLQVNGVQPTSTSTELCTGWNLIGYPQNRALPVAGALYSIDGKYDRVFGWELTDTSDPWAVFDTTVPVWANDLQTLQPGQGYWVHATEDVTLVVDPPGAAPLISLSAPLDGAEVTSPISVTGSITSPVPVTWVLEYRSVGDSIWTAFGSGGTGGVNRSLADFDPTLLLNGLYEIQFTATDIFDQSSSAAANIVLTKVMKFGLFSITFEDLNIPVSGIPIQILRTYDSRDKHTGDFGVGWTLDIKTGTYKNNRKPGDGWIIENDTSFFRTPCAISTETKKHITTIRLADQEIFRFALQVEMSGFGSAISGGCLGEASFSQTDGRLGATLEILDETAVFWPTATDQVQFSPESERAGLTYQPNDVRLTTPEGLQLELNLQEGVQRITDPNDNFLTITDSGITHSDGKSIVFTRDAQGRITSIIDPTQNSIRYVYDAAGDLVSVTGRDGHSTSFTYAGNHFLIDILNAQNTYLLRNEYDSAGRLIATIDATGGRFEYTHNTRLRQQVVKDARGFSMFYSYDEKGNVVAFVDALGNRTDFTYDSRGNVLSQTDSLGSVRTFTYDARDNVLTKTDGLGNVFTYTYNSRNQLTSITDPNDRTFISTFDNRGNISTSVDPLGNTTTYTYDRRGNRTFVTEPDGNTRRYEYDRSGNMTTYTDFYGHMTTLTYDGNGNILTTMTSRTDEVGSLVTMTTHRRYDGSGRIVEGVDPLGGIERTQYNELGQIAVVVDKNNNRATIEYDSRGNQVGIVYSDGTDESYTYDPNGNRVSWTDQAGRTTTYVYDALNRLVSVNYPNGSSVHKEYDARNREIAVIDENGHKTRREYDAAGRLIKVIDPISNETTYTYDGTGNRTSVTDANGHTTSFEYNAGNQLVRTIFPDGSASTNEYNEVGRLTAKTDQSGNTTGHQYDLLGRLTKVTNALGGEITYSYDELGNLIAQTDMNGHRTEWAYDNLGRPLKRTLPLGMSEAFTYNANGDVLSYTDFNGNTITYSYDTNNQLVRKSYSDGTDVSYIYTPVGVLASIIDYRGTTAFTYDLRDRLIEVLNPDGTTLSYSYDGVGNRTSVVIPSGSIAYVYDPANRLLTVTDPDNRTTSYTYDEVGNRTSVTYPNGTIAQYDYDMLNHLTRLENLHAHGNVISTYDYTLDVTGNRLKVVENGGRTVTYTYDALYRLLREEITDPLLGDEAIAYTYDPVGNRLTKTSSSGTDTYTYDANDRLLSQGSVQYTYDNNGSTLSKRDGTLTTTYTYDLESRLAAVQTGASFITYNYDDDGVRIRSSVDSSITSYVVDKNRDLAQVVEERDGGGALMTRYIHGDDLISQKRDDTNLYHHYDGLGSTRVLSNGGGTTVASYTYDAFGIELAANGVAHNTYLFAGEQLDTQSGLYYLRARYYQPNTGRFTSADPIEGSASVSSPLHRYIYADANPINKIDPSGLQAAYVSMPAVTISLSPMLIVGLGLSKTYKSRAQLAAEAEQCAKALARSVILDELFEHLFGTDSPDPCDSKSFKFYYPGLDTYTTTLHIAKSIMDDKQPLTLHRSDYVHDRSWIYTREKAPECFIGVPKGVRKRPPGLVCDEYPFASTKEGGFKETHRPSLKLVPAREQLCNSPDPFSQCKTLRRFYEDCVPLIGALMEESLFVVAPGTPKTTHSCKGFRNNR